MLGSSCQGGRPGHTTSGSSVVSNHATGIDSDFIQHCCERVRWLRWVSVGLESGIELGHVLRVAGQDERAQAFRYDGEMSVDYVGGLGCGEPASNCGGFVEGVDVEVADCPSEVRLSCRVSPNLGKYGVSGV